MSHPWDTDESKLLSAEDEIQKLRKTVATWQSKCSRLENQKLDNANGRIKELEKQRGWLYSLMDFSYEWMATCGCVQARDLSTPMPVTDWFRKSGEVLKYVKEEIERERKSIQ